MLQYASMRWYIFLWETFLNDLVLFAAAQLPAGKHNRCRLFDTGSVRPPLGSVVFFITKLRAHNEMR